MNPEEQSLFSNLTLQLLSLFNNLGINLTEDEQYLLDDHLERDWKVLHNSSITFWIASLEDYCNGTSANLPECADLSKLFYCVKQFEFMIHRRLFFHIIEDSQFIVLIPAQGKAVRGNMSSQNVEFNELNTKERMIIERMETDFCYKIRPKPMVFDSMGDNREDEEYWQGISLDEINSSNIYAIDPFPLSIFTLRGFLYFLPSFINVSLSTQYNMFCGEIIKKLVSEPIEDTPYSRTIDGITDPSQVNAIKEWLIYIKGWRPDLLAEESFQKDLDSLIVSLP